jgi:peptide/nickel transport system permease protein
VSVESPARAPGASPAHPGDGEAGLAAAPAVAGPGSGLVRQVLANRLGAAGAGIVLLVALAALLAPVIAPHDPLRVSLEDKLLPPGPGHWMGTDQAGRDILSRVLWGARVSLVVGVLAVVIGLAGGVLLGMLGGFYAGTLLEQVIMRTVDALFSIPLLVWAIAVVGIVGVGPVAIGPVTLPNEAKVIALVGFLYIPAIARVTYSVVLVEARADYVRARRVQGAGDLEIMASEILPNCLSPLIVQATLFVAIGIIVEASLSFVGLGVQPPRPSWGTMLADARGYVFSGEWWLPVFPGLLISLTVIGFNLLGDALRDVLDPRKRDAGLVV